MSDFTVWYNKNHRLTVPASLLLASHLLFWIIPGLIGWTAAIVLSYGAINYTQKHARYDN